MRILVISSVFPPMRVGEAEHTYHLCANLAERGFEVDLLTTKSINKETNSSFKIHSIINDWSWSDLLCILSFIRRHTPDVVLLVYIGSIYNDHPMVTFIPYFAKRLLPRTSFITQFENARGALMDTTSSLVRIIRKLCLIGTDVDYHYGTLLRDSDHIIVLSDKHRAELGARSGLVDCKTTLIPPPPLIRRSLRGENVLRAAGRNLLGIGQNEFLLIYFGYICPGKGLETLLQSYNQIKKRRGNVRLVLVGGVFEFPPTRSKPYEHEMEGLLRLLENSEEVQWVRGFDWDSEDASVYLSAADVCVLPFDGGVYMNNSSFAAAIAHGLPVISTRGDLVEYQLVDQENVYLCPPRNVEALTEAVETIISSASLRTRLQSGAKKLAREWFNWDVAIERTVATFSFNDN